jgi:peptidoglycan/xylan/chitin deacetylase (PgdA/CDA1 family)
VLMYHRLSHTPLDPSEGDYVVPPETFEAQMRMLRKQRVPVVSIDDLLAGRLTEHSVALTFDDGCDTDRTVALPILTALDMPAGFFVNPGRIGQKGYLTWEGLREIKGAGMHVGSHGLDHTLLDDLPPRDLENQLSASKRLLEAELGGEVLTLALPGGSGGERACRLARELGYRTVFGSKPGMVRPGPLPLALPRYPVREGSLEQFRTIVAQGLGLRLRFALRHEVLRLARASMGDKAYVRLRERWLLRRQPTRPQG